LYDHPLSDVTSPYLLLLSESATQLEKEATEAKMERMNAEKKLEVCKSVPFNLPSFTLLPSFLPLSVRTFFPSFLPSTPSVLPPALSHPYFTSLYLR
jgi:hypothetical protein